MLRGIALAFPSKISSTIVDFPTFHATLLLERIRQKRLWTEEK